jgi:hypothetical protein
MEIPFIIRVERKLPDGVPDSKQEVLFDYLREDAMQLLNEKISEGGEYTISKKEGKTICYSGDAPSVLLWVEVTVK